MSHRIYVVHDNATQKARLIEAGNPAQAVRHVAAEQFMVRVASPYDVAQLVSSGVTLETTKPEVEAE